MSRFFWTPEAIALLGTDTDKNIAEKLNCNWETVYQRRRELGIESFVKSRAHAKWDEITPLLGTMPDDEVARKFNVGLQSVRLHRLRNGIPNYKRGHKPVISKSSIPDHLVPLLGVYPDVHFEIQTGLSRERVRQIRELYGKPKPPSAKEIVHLQFVEAVKRAESNSEEATE